MTRLHTSSTPITYLTSKLIAGNIIVIVDSDVNFVTPNDISLGENVTFIFRGGLINSQSQIRLIGNFSNLIAPTVQIFGSNISVEGYWCIEYAYPEWFGAVAYSTYTKSINHYDSSSAINKAIKMKKSGEIRFSNGLYYINNSINVSVGILLIGKGVNFDYQLRENENYLRESSNNRFFFIDNIIGTVLLCSEDYKENVDEQNIITVEKRTKALIKVNIESTLNDTNPTWEISTPNGMATIKNLAIVNADNTDDSVTIPFGILMGGAGCIDNVRFFQIPRAIRFIEQYCDNKYITNCHFYNRVAIKQSEYSIDNYNIVPICIDSPNYGDGLIIKDNLVDYLSDSVSLRLVKCGGGIISGNIFSSKVLIKKCRGVLFKSNYINRKGQLSIIESNLTVSSNIIEKGAFIPITIGCYRIDSNKKYGSQVVLDGNTIKVQSYQSYISEGINNLAAIARLTNINEYDVQIEDCCLVQLNNCYRLYNTGAKHISGGLMLCYKQTGDNGVNTVSNINSTASNIEPIDNFNEYSSFLSASSQLYGKDVINRTISINGFKDEYDSLEVESGDIPGIWLEATGAYSYSMYLIINKRRNIIFNLNVSIPAGQKVNRVSPSTYLRFNVPVVGLLRIVRNGKYVDVPVCGPVHLIDNGHSVNGYVWKNMETLPTPSNTTIRNINIIGDNIECYAWSNLCNGGEWLPEDKIYVQSEMNFIVKSPNVQ